MDFGKDFDMPSLFGSLAYEGYMPRKPWGAISHLRIFPFPTWTICTRYCREHLSLMTCQCKLLFTLTIQLLRHSGRACQQELARTSHPSLWYLTAHLSSLASVVYPRRPARKCWLRLPGNGHNRRHQVKLRVPLTYSFGGGCHQD